jgi:transcriptional regulator with XRE-family HTH domain
MRGSAITPMDSDLATILRSYRAAHGLSQAQLAVRLEITQTYVSRIESGKRTVSDLATLKRFAGALRIAPSVLGLADSAHDDPRDGELVVIAEQMVELARIARESGKSAEAIRALRPLHSTLAAQASSSVADKRLLRHLLGVEVVLGQSLGDVLPCDRLDESVRLLRHANTIAEHLNDPTAQHCTLRALGNELRKIGKVAAAQRELELARSLAAPPAAQGWVLVALTRVYGGLLDAAQFREAVRDAKRLLNLRGGSSETFNPLTVAEAEVRGLLELGNLEKCEIDALEKASTVGVAPQWTVISTLTLADVRFHQGSVADGLGLLRAAIEAASRLKLPAQIERAIQILENERDGEPIREVLLEAYGLLAACGEQPFTARLCLSCGRPFKSSGPQNRYCKKCRSRDIR